MADITFIPLKDNRFAYLYLLTDGYSRKIVGFHVSDNMRVDSAVVAMQKAIDQKPADAIVIHHSDRGMQYWAFVPGWTINEFPCLRKYSNVSGNSSF